MTPKAHKLALRLRHGGIFTARITKRDGTERQMRFSIAPMSPVRFSSVDGSALVSVQDLDLGEPRMLRLEAVHQLTELVERKPIAAPSNGYEQMQALCNDLFH